MTDFSVAGQNGDFKVFSVHTAGRDDTTPLQYISNARLAHLLQVEAAALALAAIAKPPDVLTTPAPADKA